MKDNIVLIGMPGVGKSTVGVILAKMIGYQFTDADLLIQKQEGKLLHEIIAEKGTDGFIEIEERVNASIEASHTIIATGGSVVYGKKAMEHLSCIGTVNDAVGGVTVEMDDDYTLYNAKFKKGATVHLQGEEAQEFVQGRDITVSGSAYSRIGRQKRYLKAFISQAKKTLAQNPTLAVNLMSQLSDYMLTDISTGEVLYISTELSGCNFDEENMQILQGNIQMGEQYEEYYLDDEAVQQTIIDLFYEEQK